MDFTFVLHFISIDVKEQTKLQVNWTQIDHFSLQNPQKAGFFGFWAQNFFGPKSKNHHD